MILQGLGLGAVCLALVACSPTEVADKVGRRAAETVVRPVVSDYMTGPEAEVVTRCIVDNASAAEVQTLSRDVAVVAGSSTVDLIFRMAQNPATAACLRAKGLPPLSQVAL
jgi:hypothetical protein